MNKTTITKAVQKLITAGYVTKTQDMVDKRIWRLSPSSKTKQVYAEIIAAKNRISAICFNGVGEREIEALNHFMDKMLANLTKEWNKLMNNHG